MTILKVFAFSLFLFVVALACGRAGASESLIELTTGGLDFARSRGFAPIVLNSETVAISPVRVVFKYRISTPGPGPVEIDLAFRYPDLDFSDPDATYAIPGGDPVNFLGAKLKIAGAPAVLALSQTASLDGKNVTAALDKVHLPMVPVGDFRDKLAATPAAVRNVLEAEGLIKEAGTSAEGEPLLFPAWTVKTEGAAKMTVEPAKPVDIELAYRPSVGIRQDSLMRKVLRDNKDLAADVTEQKRLFCADPGFPQRSRRPGRRRRGQCRATPGNAHSYSPARPGRAADACGRLQTLGRQGKRVAHRLLLRPKSDQDFADDFRGENVQSRSESGIRFADD